MLSRSSTTCCLQSVLSHGIEPDNSLHFQIDTISLFSISKRLLSTQNSSLCSPSRLFNRFLCSQDSIFRKANSSCVFADTAQSGLSSSNQPGVPAEMSSSPNFLHEPKSRITTGHPTTDIEVARVTRTAFEVLLQCLRVLLQHKACDAVAFQNTAVIFDQIWMMVLLEKLKHLCFVEENLRNGSSHVGIFKAYHVGSLDVVTACVPNVLHGQAWRRKWVGSVVWNGSSSR